ncbi:MAG: ribonuclease P protein component [Bdellovibrionaceae bacterium]|nr:ribonuclease P protein component [Pseudobdellovibrionaceae bacterium]
MVSKPFQSINRNSDFLNLKHRGTKFWAASWMLVSIDSEFDPSSPKSQIGFILSRKVGNAVVRNKVRRWLKQEIADFLKENPEVKVKFSVFIKPMTDDYYKKMSFLSFKKVLNNAIKFISQKQSSKIRR